MPQRARESYPWLAGLLWTSLALGGTGAFAADPGTLDAGKIPWHELHYRASRLFVTAEATLRFEQVDPDRALLVLGSEALGRRSETRLWLDPRSARAEREEKVKIKDQAELRSYTYKVDHALKERYHERPAKAASEPAETWTLKNSERQDYFAAAASPVNSPSGLLYVLAASGLEEQGDSVDVTLFADRRLVTARAEVTELTEGHDFRLLETGGARLYRPSRVLRIALTGRDVAGEPVDLGLFGLDGDLEVLLDAEKRLPVSIRGSMPVLGKITVRLQEAKMAEGTSTTGH